jgi:hypothetical protein
MTYVELQVCVVLSNCFSFILRAFQRFTHIQNILELFNG